MAARERIPVAVLGATGLVGQRLVALLAEHRWFELVGVAGSARRAGVLYGEEVRWRIEGDVPHDAARLPLMPAEPRAHLPARVVFSALPADQAAEIEPEFARARSFVFSNASAFRMD